MVRRHHQRLPPHPGEHGALQLRIWWNPLTSQGQRGKTLPWELWDDRPFPEMPLQLQTAANTIAPGTLWTGDVPHAWLHVPEFTPEEHAEAILQHKLNRGQ